MVILANEVARLRFDPALADLIIDIQITPSGSFTRFLSAVGTIRAILVNAMLTRAVKSVIRSHA